MEICRLWVIIENEGKRKGKTSLKHSPQYQSLLSYSRQTFRSKSRAYAYWYDQLKTSRVGYLNEV